MKKRLNTLIDAEIFLAFKSLAIKKGWSYGRLIFELMKKES